MIDCAVLSIGMHNVNLHIASYLVRSIDQISYRCRKDDYKVILKVLESDAHCPGPNSNKAQAVPDSPRNDYPTNGDPPMSTESGGSPGHACSAQEIKVLQQVPPDVLDSELAPLLPSRTVWAIRSKRRWLPMVAPAAQHADVLF